MVFLGVNKVFQKKKKKQSSSNAQLDVVTIREFSQCHAKLAALPYGATSNSSCFKTERYSPDSQHSEFLAYMSFQSSLPPASAVLGDLLA